MHVLLTYTPASFYFPAFQKEFLVFVISFPSCLHLRHLFSPLVKFMVVSCNGSQLNFAHAWQ